MEEVLDYGYVKLIEDWGYGLEGIPEAGIVEAARQSTQGSFRGWDKDEKLLAHLYNNQHATPFEFAGMVIEVMCPIAVIREWHRHRTQAYNEMSARYAPMPEVNYMPTWDRAQMINEANRQAGAMKDAPELTYKNYVEWVRLTQDAYDAAQRSYQFGLDVGMAKELARMPVNVARYTKMRASTSLRCWLMFLTLRMDPNAQWEIRQFANAVGRIIETQFPRTWELAQLGEG